MKTQVIFDPHLFDPDMLENSGTRDRLAGIIEDIFSAEAQVILTKNLKDAYRERKKECQTGNTRSEIRLRTFLEKRLLHPIATPRYSTDKSSPHQGCTDYAPLSAGLASTDQVGTWILAAPDQCALNERVEGFHYTTIDSIYEDGFKEALRPNRLRSKVIDSAAPDAKDQLKKEIQFYTENSDWMTIIDPYCGRPLFDNKSKTWLHCYDQKWELSIAWLIDSALAMGGRDGIQPTITFISTAPRQNLVEYGQDPWLRNIQNICRKYHNVRVRYLLRMVNSMSDDRSHGRWLLTDSRCVQADQGWQFCVSLSRRHIPSLPPEVILQNQRWKLSRSAIDISEREDRHTLEVLTIDLRDIQNTDFCWITSDEIRQVYDRVSLRALIDEDGKVMTQRFASTIFHPGSG